MPSGKHFEVVSSFNSHKAAAGEAPVVIIVPPIVQWPPPKSQSFSANCALIFPFFHDGSNALLRVDLFKMFLYLYSVYTKLALSHTGVFNQVTFHTFHYSQMIHL